MKTDAPLLDSDFMRKLDQWSLAIRRTSSGTYGGERKSTRHGHSVEFADFRNYVPGDDIRFVDWNLYARMERLFLKLFLHEQELNVHLLVDLSESMTFGSPSKSLMARRLAAALGYLALAHQDGLSMAIGCANATGRASQFPTSRGRGFIPRMLQFLQSAPEGGELALASFIKRQLVRIQKPGLVIVLSDLLDPAGYEAALQGIVASRHELIVMHILEREEWEPMLEGDLRLVDSERGLPAEVSLTPAILTQYRRRITGWSDAIQSYCLRRGMSYLRILSNARAEDIVLKTLRQMGRLK